MLTFTNAISFFQSPLLCGINFHQSCIKLFVGVRIQRNSCGRTDTHLRDIRLIDVHFGAHIIRVGQLGDISRATARLNLTAKIDGVPNSRYFFKTMPLRRRSEI
jgi:hypothetical protein